MHVVDEKFYDSCLERRFNQVVEGCGTFPAIPNILSNRLTAATAFISSHRAVKLLQTSMLECSRKAKR
jgi:glutamate racemase